MLSVFQLTMSTQTTQHHAIPHNSTHRPKQNLSPERGKRIAHPLGEKRLPGRRLVLLVPHATLGIVVIVQFFFEEEVLHCLLVDARALGHAGCGTPPLRRNVHKGRLPLSRQPLICRKLFGYVNNKFFRS